MLFGESWRENGEDAIVKIGIEEDGKDSQPGQLDAEGCTVFKNLFISDSDKRKNFTLHVRVSICCDHLVLYYYFFKSNVVNLMNPRLQAHSEGTMASSAQSPSKLFQNPQRRSNLSRALSV
jgi:hypothetical protein